MKTLRETRDRFKSNATRVPSLLLQEESGLRFFFDGDGTGQRRHLALKCWGASGTWATLCQYFVFPYNDLRLSGGIAKNGFTPTKELTCSACVDALHTLQKQGKEP